MPVPKRRLHQVSREMVGAAVALVTDNEDPDNLGRIKIKYPWLDDEAESFWAPVVCFYAGPDRGSYLMPEVEDEVLVMFHHGDPSSPFIVGSLWNGVDVIPGTGNPDGENNTKWWQSRSGHKFIFEDKDGAESITLVDKSGNLEMIIDVAADTITIEAKTGDIYFDAPEDYIALESKTMTITASNSTTTTVGEGLNEVSKDRNETVGTNCSATASAMLLIGTKTLGVTFGDGELEMQQASLAVDGASTQTIGSQKVEIASGVRKSGPETVLAGNLEIGASLINPTANAVTLMAGMISFSAGDAAFSGDSATTFMGGLMNYSGGASISTDASLVTLC